MPDTVYAFETRGVAFFALDTTEIFFGLGDDQQAWLDAQVAKVDPAATDWTIAFGHHPYISNGSHGNAGTYEGIPSWVPGSEIPRGAFLKERWTCTCRATTTPGSGSRTRAAPRSW